MNRGLALRLLERVMDWDDATIRRESEWLDLMCRAKYDSYRAFQAGIRFVESLADWLQQFKREDRQIAYDYVRQNLVFISVQEIQHLVARFYPEVVAPILTAAVAGELGVAPWLVWKHPSAETNFADKLRRTLFLGLSDGARMDTLRRLNERLISNEQIALAPHVSESKWQSMSKELKKVQGPDAQFDQIFLIDDFVGSGTTLLRKREAGWEGKLQKFWTDHNNLVGTLISPQWSVWVHHYIASSQAVDAIEQNQASAAKEKGKEWYPHVGFTYGLRLPGELRLAESSPVWPLTLNYYDAAIETASMKEGGEHAMQGFAKCGLPLILEHNTPNNSTSLLWAETAGGDKAHSMRALFRRRNRHG